MKNNCTMKELYQDERPYEKCQRFGAENLTDAELLSVILRTGTKGENSLELAGKILHPDFGCEGLLALHGWTLIFLLPRRSQDTIWRICAIKKGRS